MLTLTRRAGQSILIGPDIEVTVVSVSGGRVRVGIRAPRKLPVHRLELVERVSDENRKALAQAVEQGRAAGAQLDFPEGLFGLSEHKEWLLCDVDEDNPIRCLMSCVDPEVQLLVVDAQVVWPTYPIEAAQEAFGTEKECAVGLIVTVPANGGQPKANLLAPLVISLEDRVGKQVVVDRPGLEVSVPVGAPRDTRSAAVG